MVSAPRCAWATYALRGCPHVRRHGFARVTVTAERQPAAASTRAWSGLTLTLNLGPSFLGLVPSQDSRLGSLGLKSFEDVVSCDILCYCAAQGGGGSWEHAILRLKKEK